MKNFHTRIVTIASKTNVKIQKMFLLKFRIFGQVMILNYLQRFNILAIKEKLVHEKLSHENSHYYIKNKHENSNFPNLNL